MRLHNSMWSIFITLLFSSSVNYSYFNLFLTNHWKHWWINKFSTSFTWMSLNIWYDFKWMVLHSIFFCVYLKSKMAATTVQCFSSWSNEEKKKKKNCSKLKTLLNPIWMWKNIGWYLTKLLFFHVDWKSKMYTITWLTWF